MPVTRYIFCLHSVGVPILLNDGIPELTVRICTYFVSHRSVVAVQRGESHELKNSSVSLYDTWDIVDLTSSHTSLNQVELNMLDADERDSAVGGRGALALASAVFEWVLRAESQSVLGFVPCISDVDFLEDAPG